MSKSPKSADAPVETPKQKKTLASMQPHSHRIDLVHPSDPDMKFWIKIKAREASMEYMFKLFSLNPVIDDNGNATMDLPPLEQFAIMIELAAMSIESWDEENIGIPFSYENAIELLSTPINSWIKDAIDAALNDNTNFFTIA